MALAIVALGLVLSTLERHIGPRGLDVVFSGDAQAARATLTVLGEGVATILGISVSITIVALQLVSQQFSPRALRNFMADRITQVMAGTFVGTFGYVLVVLRVVHGRNGSNAGVVPTASVTVAILLGILSLTVLLAFFHHMARKVQVEEISADIARNTLATLDRLYPNAFGQAQSEDPEEILEAWRSNGASRKIFPRRPGYVQRVRLDDLDALRERDCGRLHIAVAPGDFVTPGGATAEIWGTNRDGVDLDQVLESAIVVGSSRDLDHDAVYGVRQLADIAMKAISPALNDPSTAWTAIHYIKSIVERIAQRSLPTRVRRYGREGRRLLVVAHASSFEDYLRIGFIQVGRYASRDPRVAGALLEGLSDVATAASEAGADSRVASVRAAATEISQPAIQAAQTDADRNRIIVRTARVGAVVHEPASVLSREPSQ